MTIVRKALAMILTILILS